MRPINLALKTPLVFLPGKLCDQRIWQTQMDALSIDREAIFLDLNECTSIEEMTQKVAHQAPEKFILAGFSMGGYIALEFALHHSERLERLALVGSSSRGYDEKTRAFQQTIAQQLLKFKFTGLSPQAIQKHLHPTRHQDTYLTGLIQSMATTLGGEVYYRQQIATLNREDRRLDLEKITCPALVVGGREDQIIPMRDFQELAERLPHGELHVIENCGHMVPIEVPDELTSILKQWLNQSL